MMTAAVIGFIIMTPAAFAIPVVFAAAMIKERRRRKKRREAAQPYYDLLEKYIKLSK